MFKIETDVPPPVRSHARSGGGTPGPFLKTCQALLPGHSFTVASEKQKNVAARVGVAAVRTGFKFTTQKIGDGEFRVWRIA